MFSGSSALPETSILTKQGYIMEAPPDRLGWGFAEDLTSRRVQKDRPVFPAISVNDMFFKILVASESL